MSVWQLVIENPSLEQLAERFPHLRRFCGNFHTDKKLHADNKVGIVNQHQALRVNLANGEITAIA